MAKKLALPTVEYLKITDIKENPSNPRFIRDEKFLKLVNSIKKAPWMLSLRPVIINDNMIVLGGNMRLKACTEAGLKEIPVIKAEQLTPDQQREFIIKDNVGFGEWDWDMLANEFDETELNDWGLDSWKTDETVDVDNLFEDNTDEPTTPKGTIVLEYTEEDFEKISAKFNTMDGSKENIVWDLLGL